MYLPHGSHFEDLNEPVNLKIAKWMCVVNVIRQNIVPQHQSLPLPSRGVVC